MILLVIVTIVLVVCWCRLAARRIERRTTARLLVGVDGIVPGAGAIELHTAGARHAVLLLHGFGDTPQSLAYLAHDLSERGYSVVAPLLPGHGRTLHAFARSTHAQWMDAARSALDALRARYDHVGVVGLSMGGALATLLAADDAALPALVLLAPYLNVPPLLRVLGYLHPVVGVLAPYTTSAAHGAYSIRDPDERARALSYGATTPRLVAELVRLADRARAALPRVTAPTLVVQSREDNRLDPAGAEAAVQALGATEKALEWLSGCAHVVTVDYCRHRVSALVGDWLDRHMDASGPLYARRSQEQPSENR
jgi:carboxylesterase